VLSGKKISAYFLIVWDFVSEARRRGIPAMARGSGVGTMVGYTLGLSNACPVKYGLLFERFTDPDRSEYPDIDIDLCQDGRGEILEYVREKYGYVAQIITYGTMKARAAIRDVGRVLDLPLADVDKICKLIGNQLGVTLDDALKSEPDLAKMLRESPQVQEVYDTARRLEGMVRHSGVHAAGVVIATQPLENLVPLALAKPQADRARRDGANGAGNGAGPGNGNGKAKQGRTADTGILVTQWDGPTVEKMGLLKMDFLGLKTLSVLERAKELIRESFTDEEIRRIIWERRRVSAETSPSHPHPLLETADLPVGRNATTPATANPSPAPDVSAETSPLHHHPLLEAADLPVGRNATTPATATSSPASDVSAETSPLHHHPLLDAADLPVGRNATTPATANPSQRSAAFRRDPLDLDRIDFTDENVLDLYRRGETAGTFQFESDGMRNLLLKMHPDRLEDLVAGNALFRPGPMALIDDYCDRKNGRQRVPQVHEIVDRFTADTYGIMVYQEQVMQIVHELGGIPLRDAYSLIKAISKKNAHTIDAARGKFLAGAQEKGLPKRKAEELFELILRFAGYGFNKSHSVGYSILAFQTAFLKTYFPVQYMAAVLTYEADHTDKLAFYLGECKRVLLPDGSRGADVLPPDINQSRVRFQVVFGGLGRTAARAAQSARSGRSARRHGHIRFGLEAVKGVGRAAVEAILEARDADGPFESLWDFCERVPLQLVNRSTIEALIKAGAFDSLHGEEKRAALMEALESAMRSGAQAAADRESGQESLFGMLMGGGAGGGEAGAGGSGAGGGWAGGGARSRSSPRCRPGRRWSSSSTRRRRSASTRRGIRWTSTGSCFGSTPT
jgi:DNA polymerase III alpha subunit